MPVYYEIRQIEFVSADSGASHSSQKFVFSPWGLNLSQLEQYSVVFGVDTSCQLIREPSLLTFIQVHGANPEAVVPPGEEDYAISIGGQGVVKSVIASESGASSR